MNAKKLVEQNKFIEALDTLQCDNKQDIVRSVLKGRVSSLKRSRQYGVISLSDASAMQHALAWDILGFIEQVGDFKINSKTTHMHITNRESTILSLKEARTKIKFYLEQRPLRDSIDELVDDFIAYDGAMKKDHDHDPTGDGLQALEAKAKDAIEKAKKFHADKYKLRAVSVRKAIRGLEDSPTKEAAIKVAKSLAALDARWTKFIKQAEIADEEWQLQELLISIDKAGATL